MKVMADIAGSLIEKWDFDGAKYDLFNCVPNVRCRNPEHRHDTESMVEGLEWTLRDMYERTRRLKPDYVIELKQNYGTPFMRGRIPLDGEHDLFRIDDRNRDIFFLVNSGGNVPVTRDAVIFNGTFKRDLFLYSSSPVTAEMNSTDCSGRNVCRKRLSIEGWQHVETAPCGMVTIENLRTV